MTASKNDEQPRLSLDDSLFGLMARGEALRGRSPSASDLLGDGSNRISFDLRTIILEALHVVSDSDTSPHQADDGKHSTQRTDRSTRPPQ